MAGVVLRELLELPFYIVVRRHVQGTQRNVHVVVRTDHWLILCLINTLQGSDDFQVEIVFLLVLLLSIVSLIFFTYDLADWSVVLLVALMNVRDEGALARQERAAYLERLSVPVLAFCLDLDRVDIWIIFHVHQEPQLR